MRPRSATITALVLATLGFALQGRQPDEQATAGVTIARAQLALANEALNGLRTLAKTGRTSFSDPSLGIWERRKLEALRRSGASRAEMIAGIEDLIRELKKEEGIAKTMFENARGTKIDYDDIRYRRLEAEAGLNEEKAR